MYAGVGGGGGHTDSNNPMHVHLLNQRFVRGYGWRTFRWICLRIASPVTEKSPEKDVRKQAVEEQCHFFFRGMWCALSPVIATSPDSMLAQI